MTTHRENRDTDAATRTRGLHFPEHRRTPGWSGGPVTVAPEYRAFDAACGLAVVLYRRGESRAAVQRVLDEAAAQVCEAVADETCDLMRVRAIPEQRGGER